MELQYYSSKNITLEPGGGLVITASRNGYGNKCWYGPCEYSSGEIATTGYFQQEQGIFAADIKLPTGAGLWPAFWMAGVDSGQVQWPYGGEIDVIEINNRISDTVTAYAHAPTVSYRAHLRLSTSLSAGYHVYAIDWDHNELDFLIDGHTYGHVAIPAGAPFNQPFYLELDLAVGGVFPGSPNAGTIFPAHMDVAWVRVYRRQ